MSVREQWKGAKPGAEGDARASHILLTRTPFLQGYPNTTGWDRSLMALHMASSDLSPGRRWGWRQALLYYPLGRGLMLRPELKWSRGICRGGGHSGHLKLISMFRALAIKIFAEGLQSSACKGCVNQQRVETLFFFLNICSIHKRLSVKKLKAALNTTRTLFYCSISSFLCTKWMHGQLCLIIINCIF